MAEYWKIFGDKFWLKNDLQKNSESSSQLSPIFYNKFGDKFANFKDFGEKIGYLLERNSSFSSKFGEPLPQIPVWVTVIRSVFSSHKPVCN